MSKLMSLKEALADEEIRVFNKIPYCEEGKCIVGIDWMMESKVFDCQLPYPDFDKFNFCPICGRELKGVFK